MIGRIIAGISCVLLATGCGDTRRPTKHVKPAEESVGSSQKTTPGVMSPHGSFHAMPHGMPHGMPTGGGVESTGGPAVDIDSMQAPPGWVREKPRSVYVRAEYRLQDATGETTNWRLTVSVAGGGIDPNITRWRNLYFGGKPDQEVRKNLDIAGISVVVVDFLGDYNEQQGGFAPAAVHEDYRMLGAIIPLGSQQGFVKCYGPRGVVAEHEEEFYAFLRSLKPIEIIDPEAAKPAGGSGGPAR